MKALYIKYNDLVNRCIQFMHYFDLLLLTNYRLLCISFIFITLDELHIHYILYHFMHYIFFFALHFIHYIFALHFVHYILCITFYALYFFALHFIHYIFALHCMH